MTKRDVLVVALVALVSPRAFADPKADAKKHVDKATAAHTAGKFDVALSELTLAYSLDPQPALLYAIGQVHVKLGHCTEAIDFYERFIASKPAQGADEARQAIETCKNQPAEAPPPPPPPEPAHPAPPPPPPPAAPGGAFYTDVIGDALVGGGALASLIALLQYRSALADLDAADQSMTYGAQVKLVDDAHSARTVAVVFGIGGVALIGAGVYRFLTHDRGPEGHGVAVVPTQGGGFVSWAGRF